jgi:type II secretory pathway pseudopilin PulG
MRTLQSRTRSERGISLLDTVATVGVMGLLASIAVVQLGTARRSLQGDGAVRAVMAQMNTAREMAITRRRNMRLTFTNPNRVQIACEEVPGPTLTAVSSVAFEGGMRFLLTPGVPDTPDAFGMPAAIAFGTATQVKFNPLGQFVDQNGALVNGTVFVALAGEAQSTRAVTVMGSTGRVRGFRWSGRQWTRI